MRAKSGLEAGMVTITEKALIGRINRKLAHDGEQLCRGRSYAAVQELGWYIVNVQRNTIEAQRCVLLELGRELGVLADHEELAEGEE